MFSVFPSGRVDHSGRPNSRRSANGRRGRGFAGGRLSRRRPADRFAPLVGSLPIRPALAARRRIPAGRTGRFGAYQTRPERARPA